jgi:hypothetical protein
MTSGGLQKGWYADADEPGLSHYWNGTRWSGVRRSMHHASSSLTMVSLSRWQRVWYGHVVRPPGVLSVLSWSNPTVPGLRAHLEGAIRPLQLRGP